MLSRDPPASCGRISNQSFLKVNFSAYGEIRAGTAGAACAWVVPAHHLRVPGGDHPASRTGLGAHSLAACTLVRSVARRSKVISSYAFRSCGKLESPAELKPISSRPGAPGSGLETDACLAAYHQCGETPGPAGTSARTGIVSCRQIEPAVRPDGVAGLPPVHYSFRPLPGYG